MGSYYMVCAVSNMTIIEGAEVVAFKLQKENGSGRGDAWTFNREWFISEYPYHGVYNDYGNVLLPDGSEVSSRDSDLMIMYKWAWEVVTKAVKEENDRMDALYEEWNAEGKNYTNYRKERIQQQNEYLIEMKQFKDVDIVDLMKNDRLKYLEYSRFLFNDVLSWFGEGCGNSNKYWKDRILESDNPQAELDRFREEVLPVMYSVSYVYYRLYPSMYGSQEFNNKEMKALFNAGLNFIKEKEKEWGIDEE